MQGSTTGKGREDGSNECHFSGKDCITWRKFCSGWGNNIDTRHVTCCYETALASSTDKMFQVSSHLLKYAVCYLVPMLCLHLPYRFTTSFNHSVIIPESKPSCLGFQLAKHLHKTGIPVSVVIFFIHNKTYIYKGGMNQPKCFALKHNIPP